jgi:diaminopropionate ammonia-lyase
MQHVGRDPSSTTWADLLDVAAAAGPLTLATATDGNHGRGVARIACLLGYDAVVYVPQGTAPVRIGAIAGEGPRCRSTRQL